MNRKLTLTTTETHVTAKNWVEVDVTPLLSYDAENRSVNVTGPSVTASFVYDGDGRRVKSTINGTTTIFVGSHYEATGSTITKHYFAGAQRVAMRTRSTLSYLLSDHLGEPRRR